MSRAATWVAPSTFLKYYRMLQALQIEDTLGAKVILATNCQLKNSINKCFVFLPTDEVVLAPYTAFYISSVVKQILWASRHKLAFYLRMSNIQYVLLRNL